MQSRCAELIDGRSRIPSSLVSDWTFLAFTAEALIAAVEDMPPV